MTSAQRRDITKAHASLHELHRRARRAPLFRLESLDELDELLNDVLKALPPNPAPTMADIEWNDDKHCMAEAQHPEHGAVIMLTQRSTGMIACLARGKHDTFIEEAQRLTPTGKRYTLNEEEN